ncbi:MAG TPA: PTS sugar transporter subunit IIA [Pirellulales bacterium]|nr:PTS sugar transporter subunit IIA [Pirellulales bacterium]
MYLRIRDVAFTMQVSERIVRHWIQDEGLPTQILSGQTCIHRLAFFEWALSHRIARATAILGEHPVELWGHEPLAKAIETGEVLLGLAANDRESALCCAAQRLRLPGGVDRRTVVELFLSRRFHDWMSVGEGMLAPHPRRPVILPVLGPRIAILHFERPVVFGSGASEFVQTLFVIESPTVRCHQMLLGHLVQFLWDGAFRSLVRDLANREELARFVRSFVHRHSAAEISAAEISAAGLGAAGLGAAASARAG